MLINVPTRSGHVLKYTAKRKVLKYHAKRTKGKLGDRQPVRNDVICQVTDKICYYPYYIGEIYTKASRIAFSDKVIYWFVIGDACSEDGYLVLSKRPPLKQLDVSDESLLSPVLSREKFLSEILDRAITEKINRQYIYGKPYSKKMEKLIAVYVPGWQAEIYDQISNQKYTYFVNRLTGEVKKI